MNLLSNPLYWIFIIVCLFIIVIGTKYYSNIIGWFGEHWVKEVLSKLDKNVYTVLNDILIYVDGKSMQIDHIVVSKFGIFVIETKQYNGYITGSKYDKRWVRHTRRKKYYYENPIRQNYGHVLGVCELLGLDENKVFNVVCIPSRAVLKVDDDGELTRYETLLPKIKRYNIEVLDNVSEIVNIIKSSNVIRTEARKQHISDVKNSVVQVNDKQCPKCGGVLILRNGKYGNFIGCSNYPKCRYIRK